MFPIALDLTKINILLIGKGEAMERRHKQLVEYGATQISSLRGDEVDVAIQSLSSSSTAGLAGLLHFVRNDERIIMVCGLSYEISKQLATEARAAGKLVNVEDMNDLCDFYFTANIKRGDLVISVSTGGASPTLSRKIRDYIAGVFDVSWENKVVEIADFRKKLKEQNKTIPEVLAESEKFLASKGWLK
jgi:precorrin-2 dehydrogenase/sirohydrochlorin ferrochelatase